MAGTALKKLAEGYGLTMTRGIAHGEMRGYAVTLNEGAGYKRLVVSTKLDEDTINELIEIIKVAKCDANYNVANVTFTPMMTQVIFYDTTKKPLLIDNFLDWFFPLLDEHNATKADLCPYCGEALSENAERKLIYGAVVYLHEACVHQFAKEHGLKYKGRIKEEEQTYLKGAIGAGIGAAIGLGIWILVRFAGVIALIIGWLVDLGYTLGKGKTEQGRAIIISSITVLTIVLGTLITVGLGDIELFLKNLFVALCFGAIGCFYFLRRKNIVSSRKPMQDF